MVVIKSKDHTLKWVKILSELMKTLLDLSISEEGWKKMKSENKNKCGHCDKLFSSDRYLITHATKMHKEEKPIITGTKTCIKCNKKFLTEWNLKSHNIVCSRQAEGSKKRKKQPEPAVSSTSPESRPNSINT